MPNNSMKPIKPYQHMRERYGSYAYIYYKHAVKLNISKGIKIPTYLQYYHISPNKSREREYPKYKVIYKIKL